MGRTTSPRRERRTVAAQATPLVRGLGVTLVLVALLAAVTGTALWQRDRADAAARPSSHADLGGLSADVRAARWMSMDAHHMDGTGRTGGYQMPSQMMPGAPEGDDMRLGIPITLVNTSDELCRFDLAEEFFLAGGRTGKAQAPHSDTLGGLARLTPGSAVRGVLYFDTGVPRRGDPKLTLLWKRDGHERRLSVRLPGAAPAPKHHQHGP